MSYRYNEERRRPYRRDWAYASNPRISNRRVNNNSSEDEVTEHRPARVGRQAAQFQYVQPSRRRTVESTDIDEIDEYDTHGRTRRPRRRVVIPDRRNEYLESRPIVVAGDRRQSYEDEVQRTIPEDSQPPMFMAAETVEPVAYAYEIPNIRTESPLGRASPDSSRHRADQDSPDGFVRRNGADRRTSGRIEPITLNYSYSSPPLYRTYESRDRETVVPQIIRPMLPDRDMDVYDDFEFFCPKTEATPSEHSSDFDTFRLDRNNTVPVEAEASWTSDLTSVYLSQYRGDAELGGYHNAQLAVIHGLKSPNRPLFKWLHIKQDVMNFDEFWNEIHRKVNLSDARKDSINRLRAKVRMTCVKSRYNPQGQQVGYLEPKMVEIPIKPEKKLLMERKDENQPMAKWVCVPYFSLQQYAGLGNGSSKSVFPNMTLLQDQYSRSTRQRDMEQAVCQLDIAEKGECFHISQLWSVVLGNDLLVTCGEMAKTDLKGESLTLTSELSNSDSTANLGRIFVQYGEAVVWTFDASECSTWFAFTAHFLEFWPKYRLVFEHHDKPVAPEEWPKLLKYIKTRGSVILVLKTSKQQDEALTRGVLEPEVDESKLAVDKPTVEFQLLNVLTLRSQTGSADAGGTEIDMLQSQMQSAETFLTEKTSFSKQSAYNNCPINSRSHIYQFLVAQGAQVDEKKDDALKRVLEDCIDLFNAADCLFQLFLPKCSDYPTTNKFWGAIMELISLDDVDLRREARAGPYGFQARLCGMMPSIHAFQEIMSCATQSERAKIELPREFGIAWLHVMSALVTHRDRDPSWRDHQDKAEMLIQEGMAKIILSVSTSHLLDNAAVLPLEVLSLITLQLLKDRVSAGTDILETYSQYLSSLDTDITIKAPDRSYQHRIDLVKQELLSVRKTIWKQRFLVAEMSYSVYGDDRRIVDRAIDTELVVSRKTKDPTKAFQNYYLRSRMNPDPRGLDDNESAVKLSPTDQVGFRGLFVSEFQGLMEQRDFDFSRYAQQAEYLTEMVAYKMESTKDKQENAVYAFTIVTIIFLPLSAIAGIFGMNTNDIRDLDQSQWLYWVVALPVTAGVIIGGLWWMNELGNVMRWLTGQKSGSGISAKGFTAAPISYDYPVPESPSRYPSRVSTQQLYSLDEESKGVATRKHRYRDVRDGVVRRTTRSRTFI